MNAQLKYRASIVLMAASLAFAGCDGAETTTTTTDSTATQSVAAAPADGTVAPPASTPPVAVLNTTDVYTDLRTGRQMHLKQSAAGTSQSGSADASSSNSWMWENDEPLDYFYVNNATHDTFRGATGEIVNGYLLYDAAHKRYDLDELRYEKNGDGYKAKSDDGELKIKENDNELKIKDGDTKLKVNDNEVKYKDKANDIKYKSNGDETKIKTKDQKIEIEDGKTKVKPR